MREPRTDGELRRRELAALLRHHRRATDPASVNLPTADRRRQPGLRREEVALLSGVGLTWYTWLEQGRRANPSTQVIDALAVMFRLGPDAHDHLRRLAGLPPRERHDPPSLPDHADDVLDTLLPAAAYISDEHWNVLAHNRAEGLLLPELDTAPAADRNIIWLLFTAPTPRRTMPDWEQQARSVLAQFRAQWASRLPDAADEMLISRLTSASEHFRSWWPEPDVAGFRPHARPFHHPTLGPLLFHHHKLTFAHRPTIRLTIYTPADPETTNKIAAQLGSERRLSNRAESLPKPPAATAEQGPELSDANSCDLNHETVLSPDTR